MISSFREPRAVAAILPVLIVLMSGCGKSVDASTTQHLSPTPAQCAIDQSRTDLLSAQLSNAIDGDRGAAEIMMRTWSTVPAVFTDYIVQRAQAGKLRIQLQDVGGWAGLTYGGMDGTEPVNIQLLPDAYQINGAAIHELGHAVQSFSFRLPGNDPRIESQAVIAGYYDAMNGSDAAPMWGYSKKNQYEWFASAFSQYWCSRDSQNEMRALFPSSFAFMEKLYSGVKANGAVETPSTGGSTGGTGGGLGNGTGGAGGVNDVVTGKQTPVYLALSGVPGSVQVAGSAPRIAPGQYMSLCLKAAAACTAETDWKPLNFVRNVDGRNIFLLPSAAAIVDGQKLAVRVLTGTNQEVQGFTVQVQ